MPFEHAFKLILIGINNENKKRVENIYYFAQQNGFNQKYPNAGAFFNDLMSEKTDKKIDEIMEDVKNILSGIGGEGL